MVRSVVTRFALLLGLMATAASLPVMAVELCAPTIQSLSRTVLAGQQHLPPLQARRFGSRAIYLLLRYGTLEQSEAERLLAEAIATRVHGAADLDFAWRVHSDGVAAALAQAGPDALAVAVDTGRPSSLRALLTAGHAADVMAALAALPEASRWDLGQMLVAVMFDQPDAFKAELAGVAEEQGLDWLAAGLAAAQLEPDAWLAHLEGKSVAERDELARLWGWMPAFNGNPTLPYSTASADAEALARRDAIRLVNWAAATQPERDLLGTFLNQTGQSAEATDVAKSLLKQFKSGALELDGPLDAGWLATLEAFAALGLDLDQVRSGFGTGSSGLNRLGRDSVSDVLDWIVAVDALTPYLRGTGELPGAPPPTISSDFAGWDHWLALAEAVRAGTMLDNPAPDDLPILAELLLASDQWEPLAQLVAAQPASLASVTLADDLAGRIDRLCDAHLWHRGEAVLLSGRALYSFD